MCMLSCHLQTTVNLMLSDAFGLLDPLLCAVTLASFLMLIIADWP